ncbi:MAG: alkaline phosphatase family protein, partial [Bacteroidota bacterium]|nr:alkaline phosphatase family protein [Bacteroidota bacterium]
ARGLLAETLGDKMKLFTKGKSKVYSVALNPSSAILSAGHAANGAFWFDTQTGNMISSSYYISAFPNWVRDFNMKKIPQSFFNNDWNTLLLKSNYEESVADNYILEKGFSGKWNTFPYDMGKLQKGAESMKVLKATPFGNSLVRQFAENLVEQEKLGAGQTPDLLTLVFSSMDYENSSFGPSSVEMEDLYMRMDQDIAGFLHFLDKKFGNGKYLFFLTSNVSSSYNQDYLKEDFRMPTGTFNPQSAVALLKSYLNITYGQGEWILDYSNQQIYLNQRLIEQRKIKLEEIQEKAASFLNEFEGVKTVLPAFQVEYGLSAAGEMKYFQNSYRPNRSGDILLSLEQGWTPVNKYRKDNYTENNQVPLIWYGQNIKAGEIGKKLSIVNVVPTICRILSIPTPEFVEGECIQEIIW